MLALLCGGQGQLSADIFDLAAERPEAEAIFDTARALLGHDPRHLVRDGDEGMLLANHTSQILSVTAVLSAHACIAAVLPGRFAVTGYSVGEMAAWSIAGIWTADTALRLTDVRARAMDEAGGVGGGMACVRGLARPALEGLAARHDCAIAIVNPDKLFVVAGADVDVAALCSEAMTIGATRTGLLAVKIASHTPYLRNAVVPIRKALESAHSAAPAAGRVLLSGGDGARVFSAGDATVRLASQVATPVDWAATLDMLVEYGIDRVLDLGPGHALSDMMRNAFPAISSQPLEAFRSIEGIQSWIGSPE